MTTQETAHAGADELATKVGSTLLQMLTAAHGHEKAHAFAVSITTPTFPGTPERVAQDTAWGKMTARLIAVAKPSAAPAGTPQPQPPGFDKVEAADAKQAAEDARLDDQPF